MSRANAVRSWWLSAPKNSDEQADLRCTDLQSCWGPCTVLTHIHSTLSMSSGTKLLHTIQHVHSPVQQLNLILVRSVHECVSHIQQVIAEHCFGPKAGTTQLDGKPDGSTLHLTVCRCIELLCMVWLKHNCDLGFHAWPDSALSRTQLKQCVAEKMLICFQPSAFE